jgi:hypothetical protein
MTLSIGKMYITSNNKMSNKKKRNVCINVTSRRVHETHVDMEKQYVLHILSVCL